MECPKCQSKRFVKNGIVRKKQRYKCKECKCNFTQPYQGKKPPKTKLLACVLYLNGLGFRRIGAILKVNHNSVIRWVKEYGEEIEKTFPVDKTKKHCKVIEIDEMWHYIGKKKQKLWIWIALDRETKEVLAWQTGSRGKKTLKKLLIQISHISCDYYATDKWKVYRQLIPDNKLIQSKAETHIIESQNCRVRHYLARFCQRHPLGKRKTLCYSKSVAMVNLTLLLFFRAPPLSIF